MRNSGSMPDASDVRPDQATVPLPSDYIAPRVDGEHESARSLVLALLREVGLDKR
jgi:hypothetical protein